MFAISAWFDETGEAVVRSLWLRMAEAEVDDSLAAGPYRPHITLGVWEELPVDAASARLMALTSESSAFPVTFRAIGVYPGHPFHHDRKPGVWLAPTVTSELNDLHGRVHSQIGDLGSHPIHRHVPGRWEPHCTLAVRLTPALISPAVEIVLEASVLPLTVRLDRLGLIDTPAEVELASFSLAEQASGGLLRGHC